MIQETPGKVMGFLGAALLSMSFLFAVTVTNMPMNGQAENSVPDLFGPEHVVSMLGSDPFSPENVAHAIDTAASGYSKFLARYLVEPAETDLAFLSESVKANYEFAMDNAAEPIVRLAGLGDLLEQEPTPMARRAGDVAGAYTAHVVP
jgi:hypothetical protein